MMDEVSLNYLASQSMVPRVKTSHYRMEPFHSLELIFSLEIMPINHILIVYGVMRGTGEYYHCAVVT